MEATNIACYANHSYSKKIDLRSIWLLVIVFAVITYGSHAVARHGEDAVLVRQCMEQQGPAQVWVKPDGRVINVCKIADGKFGIMITDGTHEITSFIKAKLSRLAQVEQYLRNLGAERIYYP